MDEWSAWEEVVSDKEAERQYWRIRRALRGDAYLFEFQMKPTLMSKITGSAIQTKPSPTHWASHGQVE